MTEAERLAERTPERIWLIDMGDCIAWCDDPDPSGTGEDDAVEYVRATLIRSQAEELERLRGALGELSDYETDRASMWADQHNEWTKDEMHKIARAALGER